MTFDPTDMLCEDSAVEWLDQPSSPYAGQRMRCHARGGEIGAREVPNYLTLTQDGLRRSEMTVTTTRRWLPWLAVIVIILGFANFQAFLIESNALGGDALNGHVTDGHFYVTSHGTDTEVSQAVWTASQIHALVTLLSWPLVMLAGAFLLFRYIFPFLMSGKAPGQASERVAALRASGTPLWEGWPGGVAGPLHASAGLLGAEVYAGGIVVTPRLMSPSAIRTDGIRSVRPGRRLVTAMIEVEHAGIDVSSPLILYGGPDSPLARVLLALASDKGAGIPPAAGAGVALPHAPPGEGRPRAVPCTI